MALGIVLHAALFLVYIPLLPIHDAYSATDPNSNPYRFLFLAIHGFRMPVFFLLSGYFTALLWQRRGLEYLVVQRLRRVGLPLLIGALTIVPLNNRLFFENDPEMFLWPLSSLMHLSHLWFLWHLLLLGTIFLLAVRLGAQFRHPAWWLLIPLTVLPMMQMTDRTFGADLSAGVLVAPKVLAYYATFFFFGAFFYQSAIEVRRWWALLLLPALTLVFFPGIALTSTSEALSREAFVAAVLQVTFAWMMCFGLMAFFRLLASRERYWIRYVSDASYWLYLVHLTPTLLLQKWLVDQPLNPHLKFWLIIVVVCAILLLIYGRFVRYSWIGTMLNGKRERRQPVTG